MRLRDITLAGIILLLLATVISPVNAVNESENGLDTGAEVDASVDETQFVVDDIEPDDNIIGPDHVLYRLRLAFEDIDVAFTFNESEKVGKQISQARHRLAEIKTALKNNNLKAAEKAIDQYQEETKKAEEAISRLEGKDSGLMRAQARIANHSYVLERLIESHPNNTGLLRAFNNSERLIEKFMLKTNVKFERWTDKHGRKVLKHVKVSDDGSGEYEKTSIKAEVKNNRTKVNVELKILTNSTESPEIASDILERIKTIQSNVSGFIKIERDGEEDDRMDVTGGKTVTLTTVSGEMRANAEVKGNTARVRFEYTFILDVTEDAAIKTAVEQKLSTLTLDNIQSVLNVMVEEQGIEIKKRVEEKRIEVEEKKRENQRVQIEKRDSKLEESGSKDR
jgi:hypothetical protein